MYLSKESIINLFFQMNFLYSGEDIQKQGGTQFFSELKYFLALDEFIKLEQKPCDTRNKDDKQKFVANVGHFVQLSDPDASESLDAKNFFDSFGQNRDFDVGSNFFSAGAVNKSLTSTTPLPFPSRHPQLLTCENGKLSITDGAYERFANEKDYLFYENLEKKTALSNKKALLFFWLNRNTDFTSKDSLFNDFLSNLQKRYSPNMISALEWDKQDTIYTNIVRNLSFTNDISFVKKEDLIFDQKDLSQTKNYFETWLCLNTSGDDGFRKHCVDICEQWLDKKIPGEQIGNIFRHKNYETYKREHARISALEDFSSVSDNDQSGRPRTAINHYLNFLARMTHTEKIDEGDFFKLLKQLEQEIEKNPERIDALKRLLPPEYKKDKDLSGTKSPSTPSQIIYYGVPGCGKSYEVNKAVGKKLKEHSVTDKQYHTIRCVFHPEYSNADFVGQIYPCVMPDNKGVEYKFKPGPFSEIVRRAYLNPEEPFFLIIEEINRGNAAAIFGESFQLLDRIKVGEPADDSTENIYGEGWSSYSIDNQDINAYIRDQQRKYADKLNGHCSCVKGGCSDSEQEGEPRFFPFIDISSEKLNTTWVHKEGEKDKYEKGTLHFSANTAIRLPPNLSIYATMNTSDQNVFTLDNAFQRRFKSRMIRNELKNKAQYNIKIERTNVYWGAFRDWINDKILSTPGISKADDKCLGGWFISTSVETKDDKGNVTKFKDIERKDFAEKVIKYLWDDVFKRNTATVIFKKGSGNGEFKSLSELIDAFENETLQETEVFDKVFKLCDTEKTNLSKAYDEQQSDEPQNKETVEGEPLTHAPK